MTRPRLVNLLDDFALGGVTRMLTIFDGPVLQNTVDSTVMPISGRPLVAPRIDADVIATHFPPSWQGLAFLTSLRLRNPDAILVHVEHSYTGAWEDFADLPSKRRFRLMLRIALSFYDRVVCVSEGQANWLASVSGLAADKLEVIHPVTENPGLDKLPLPAFSRSRPLRIGAYGRFAIAKGFDRLIEAKKSGHLPGCDLLLGGYGEEEAHLRALAGNTPGITFAGRIDDVPAFLAECDVIAVPSRWEAYGLVANEAREAGRPILVSPVDGLPEQVGAAGMVVDFDNPADIARAIAALDVDALQAMANAGRMDTRDCRDDRARKWKRMLDRLCGYPAIRSLLIAPSA